ncbi:MAG: hypothetical protein KDB35_06395 [Acidimicrobiales bacterium]|nr:hypothetical protein [Acidimicrobiales bacterium]MCB1014726.1 hypothetical protein [Acidimicrobiales bacterium]
MTTITTTQDPTTSTMTAPLFPVGTRVEVRRRFDQHWAKGFEVADHDESGYRVRRLSDGELLPVSFDEPSLRKERKKSTWWY